MPFIKFSEDGKWLDEFSKPIIKVQKGKTYEVSTRCATIAVKSGKGELIHTEPKKVEIAETGQTREEQQAESKRAQEALQTQADLEQDGRDARKAEKINRELSSQVKK